MIPKNFLQLTLIFRKFLTPDIFELVFEKPAGFTYAPGQFVQFKIPARNASRSDAGGPQENNPAASSGASFVLRTYSIASHPGEPELKFCVKDLPDGKAPAYFKNLKIGDGVEVALPAGYFVLQPSPVQTNIFIATGTGLAPVRSLVLESLKNNFSTKLLFGVRREEDIFWDRELTAWATQYKNFSYLLTLSRPSENWTGSATSAGSEQAGSPQAGLKGRVSAHLPALIQSEAEYYLCGSLPMVKEVRQILLEHKIDSSRIHFEIF
ncbi:MAG: FAD-dependent oxidoreductase [Candidatus Magasanikbacteria bacterium]|nr:FAD-dependent oxidoreductase [Candidatus Magasanikbacteria bacterium]